MKLKKFFKPLVTVSALSFMLMGCADDSSNSGGSTTPPPTAESVFSNFLAGFQSAPAKNAEKPVEFTTNTATKPSLTVAKGEEVQYLVSLDNVMAVYYAMFNIEGTSTLLTETAGADAISGVTKFTNYKKVDITGDTTDVQLTLTNGTNSLYTGMFALMTEQEVKDLDAALGELDKEIEESKPTAGDVTKPDLTKIQAATVQKVVDLINGKMYKVAYNSPAQSIQDAFAAAQPLTLKTAMAFNVNDSSAYEIAAGFSFAESDPVVGATSVVVFLDNFENLLNGMDTTNAAKDVVKGKGTLTNAGNLGITTETLSNSATQNIITYSPADEVVAGAKVTYVAILENTDTIDAGSGAFKTLSDTITAGATKAEVEAALALLSGKIYKVDYTVNTIQSLIDAFKASTEATTAVDSATPLTLNTNYEASIKGEDTWTTNTKVYCLDISTEDPRLTLSTLDGSAATDALSNYIKTAAAQDSDGDGKIVFTLTNGQTVKGQTVYAYCSSAADRSGGDAFNTAITGGTTNYEKLNGFLGALKTELKVYSYAIPTE